MVHNDSDQELGARLDSALRAHLGSDQVDVPSLMHGSRQRARRIRSQRIAGFATAVVLLIGLPTGFEILRAAPVADAPRAAMLPSIGHAAADSPSRLPVPAPRPPAVPAPSIAGTAGSPGVGGAAIAAAVLTAADLPVDLTLVRGAVKSSANSVVGGQTCAGTGPGGAQPVSRQHWLWAGADTTAATGMAGTGAGLAVDLTLTSWAGDGATRAITGLRSAAAVCHWAQPQTIRAFSPGVGIAAWSSTSTQTGRHYGRAVVQVGDVVAGVEVQHVAGDQAAVALAQRLAEVAATRLAGVVPTAAVPTGSVPGTARPTEVQATAVQPTEVQPTTVTPAE